MNMENTIKGKPSKTSKKLGQWHKHGMVHMENADVLRSHSVAGGGEGHRLTTNKLGLSMGAI